MCRAWGFVRSFTSWPTSLGLTGYVFNSSSGVTIEIEGGGSAVDEFLQDAEGRSSAAGGDHPDHRLRNRSPGRAQAFLSWAAGRRPANLRWSLPTRAPATLAGAISEIRQTGATDIRSPIAPIAARATPSSATYLMTARPPPCRPSPCALTARRNMKIPSDRRFHAQPNACAVCGPSLALVETRRPAAVRRIVSFSDKDSLAIIRQARGAAARRARSLRSRGWAAFCWPAMRPTMRRSRSCEDASGVRTSPSR